jgi:hypothetical protein
VDKELRQREGGRRELDQLAALDRLAAVRAARQPREEDAVGDREGGVVGRLGRRLGDGFH